MLDTTTTKFSHVKPADTAWRSDGRRDFFQYKDLGIEQATAGRVIAQRVRANMAPEKGTSHRESCTTCSTTHPTWSTSRSSVRQTSHPSTRRALRRACDSTLGFALTTGVGALSDGRSARRHLQETPDRA